MKNRKTLHSAKKNKDLDCVLLEWVQQRRIERMTLTGLMVMKQARQYHEELNITKEYKGRTDSNSPTGCLFSYTTTMIST